MYEEEIEALRERINDDQYRYDIYDNQSFRRRVRGTTRGAKDIKAYYRGMAGGGYR